ncbi:MAG: hypothetical protein WCA85_26035 [Paraburkholderia sp.]|uniref:hypothetical protein n=1 Tax=Paraburkholderia sp. TaxID=1926495 RepID=UPI003C45754D
MSNELSAARIRALKDAVWAECEAFECTDDEARRMLSAIDSVKCVAPPAADSTPVAGVPVAWLYDRIGSGLNPHLELASSNMDKRRVGLADSNGVLILSPDSNCTNWRPLYAAPASAQPPVAVLTQEQLDNLIAGARDWRNSAESIGNLLRVYLSTGEAQS